MLLRGIVLFHCLSSVKFIFFCFEEITIRALAPAWTVRQTVGSTIVCTCIITTTINVQVAIVLDGTTWTSVYPQGQPLVVESVAELGAGARLGGTEPLVDSFGRPNRSLIYPPVEEQHYKHRNEERPHGGVDDVIRLVHELTVTLRHTCDHTIRTVVIECTGHILYFNCHVTDCFIVMIRDFLAIQTTSKIVSAFIDVVPHAVAHIPGTIPACVNIICRGSNISYACIIFDVTHSILDHVSQAAVEVAVQVLLVLPSDKRWEADHKTENPDETNQQLGSSCGHDTRILDGTGHGDVTVKGYGTEVEN